MVPNSDVMTRVAADVIMPPADGVATFSDVQRLAGVSRGALRTAVKTGQLVPTEIRKGPGRSRGYTLTWEDALLVIACSLAAMAAGVAFNSMLRILRTLGTRVDPAAVTVAPDGTARLPINITISVP